MAISRLNLTVGCTLVNRVVNEAMGVYNPNSMYRVRASTSGALKDLRKDMKKHNKLSSVKAKTLK